MYGVLLGLWLLLPVIAGCAVQPVQRELPRIWETSITLPTYPYVEFQSPAFDAAYGWPYARFDPHAFAQASLEPRPVEYRLVIMENHLLRLELMPELGGRIRQVEHKPTGQTLFYANPVVRPSPWGPPQQLGWAAVGGMEWGLPVFEHGYDWGTIWEVETFSDTDGAFSDGTLRAVLATPQDGRFLTAQIEIRLPADGAYFEVTPHLTNHTDSRLHYDFWINAMLAPGAENSPGPETHFVLPGRLMQVHSRGDETLPPDAAGLRWPHYGERDLSRLGDFSQYLGYFEYPQARGPFVAVYDSLADAGGVRVYPADTATGSKVFSFGWQDPIPSELYTDDGSTYVELHGGVARSFFEQAMLEPGASLTWRERWYPVAGLGGLAHADAWGALNIAWPERDTTLRAPDTARRASALPVIGVYAAGSAFDAAALGEGGPEIAVEVQLLHGSRIVAAATLSLQPGQAHHIDFGDMPTAHNVAWQDISEVRVIEILPTEKLSTETLSTQRLSTELLPLGGDETGVSFSQNQTSHRVVLSYFPDRR